MSRIGRLPVAIPAGVEVTVADGNVVTVKGPKGTLERALPTELEIKVEDGHVVVTRPNDLKRIKALHGLTRRWKIQKVLSPQLMETRSSYLVSAKKKLASTQLRSETREDLSHTRARESSTLTKLSDVKSVRPVRNN